MAKTSARLRQHAREMRRHPTRGEDRLWSWLRDRRLQGHKFRRQVPIGPYIADFYCPELGLVVELDGSQHQTREMCEYDGVRALELQQRGIQVLRIANEVFIRDSLLVGEMLSSAVRECCARRERLRGM